MNELWEELREVDITLDGMNKNLTAIRTILSGQLEENRCTTSSLFYRYPVIGVIAIMVGALFARAGWDLGGWLWGA